MPVFALTETMLYCPKCQKTYEEGSQRFCSIEGERLVAAPFGSAELNGGVFSSVLGKRLTEKPFAEPKPETASEAKIDLKTNLSGGFVPPQESKIFKSEPETDSLLEIAPEKPSARFVKPDEIFENLPRLGDRKTSPSENRPALSKENPDVLLGQTVKGRYLITDKADADDYAISFFAEDKIFEGKKVLVKVLLNEDSARTQANKAFAEERVSLSHIIHPNVASVIDSGALPEGFPFVVTEYVEGKSLKDLIAKTGQFDAARAARIIRQAADALSEVHGNGILHRNLIPENIVLTKNEINSEQAKLTNFGVSKGELNKRNILYKSPEEIEKKTSSHAGDTFSLAVIAYQMLTNRLPFKGNSKREFLKAQRAGLVLRPTDLKFDLPALVDEVLEKALAFEPEKRYAKARDFGEAFFAALTETPSAKEAASAEFVNKDEAEENESADVSEKSAPVEAELLEIGKDKFYPAPKVSKSENLTAIKQDAAQPEAKPAKDLLWEKRSPEPPVVASKSWNFLAFFGVAVLLAGLFGVWYYFINRPNQEAQENAPAAVQNNPNPPPISTPEAVQNAPSDEIEVPPLSRSISQPPNTIYFENTKQNLKGALMRNFLGFSLYYPKSWTRNATENKFLDISKNTPEGIPVEQMLVSYYESRGTFKMDKEFFPALVENSNKDLKQIIPNYQTLSEGEIKINGNWKAYEVKFQGGGETKRGVKQLVLWGRRLWIPASRPGIKSGYVLTMFATSLSRDVTSVDDVGVKGELAAILETFEPNQNF